MIWLRVVLCIGLVGGLIVTITRGIRRNQDPSFDAGAVSEGWLAQQRGSNDE